MELERISLRKGERGLIVGGVGAGKSTLEEAMVADFFWRYPTSLQLILDPKPRFRAEYEASGMPARRRYRGQDHGPKVPGAVVVDDPGELEMAAKMGARIFIAQTSKTRRNVEPLVEVADRFYDMSRTSRPQLLVVDETLDFFRTNGSPIGGDALIRAARSGRERGLGALYVAQILRNFSTQILVYINKCYRFRVDADADLKRLRDMGAPPEMWTDIPKREQVFDYWTKQDYEMVYGPYKLALSPRARMPADVEPVTLEMPAAASSTSTRTAPASTSWARRRAGAVR